MLKERTLTKYSLFLIPIGILINFCGVKLALWLKLPVFLDSVGTILAAALGGYLPGILVGFFSNALNSMSDPITLYYGMLSILIAVAAAWFSSRRVFARTGTALVQTVPVFALIGGAMGSVLTWMLYDQSFGQGISAPLAHKLYDNTGLGMFWSQFTADVGIDLLDKLVTVALVCLLIRLLPDALLQKLPGGRCCLKSTTVLEKEEPGSCRGSVRNKVIGIIAVTAVVLGTLAVTISYLIYVNNSNKKDTVFCKSVAAMVSEEVDGDRVQQYLDTGNKDRSYEQTRERLQTMRDSLDGIKYIYVYQILEDGCHVVFDADTPDLKGEKLGAVVSPDEAFQPYYSDLLAGRSVPPIVSHGAYGWLLTVYQPITDSKGNCVAYAAADMAMSDVITDRYAFIIRMSSLLFGATIIIVAFAVWFAERNLVEPINAMTEAADEFAYENEIDRLQTTLRLRHLNISTGDEIENLYRALRKTVTDMVHYIGIINKNAALISQMQQNIILEFANMVESRDLNTGEHIRHTADYVRRLAEELQREGKFSDILTDSYIRQVANSAPLHDIGKIKISDTLLNKPGKLTPEEFEIMKTHTTAGRDILRGALDNLSPDNTEYMTQAINMATYHHERWDGAGYPEGLKGEQIPLCARIMAVADVYDALISKRSYKAPFTPGEATRIIISESGTHFDPSVVEAFLHLAGHNIDDEAKRASEQAPSKDQPQA